MTFNTFYLCRTDETVIGCRKLIPYTAINWLVPRKLSTTWMCA